MTDELDPQTQQHIDDSADTIDDCDTSTSSDGGIDAAVEEAPAAADEAGDANVAADQGKEEQLEQPDPSDTEPKAENAPQAAGPIEVFAGRKPAGGKIQRARDRGHSSAG